MLPVQRQGLTNIRLAFSRITPHRAIPKATAEVTQIIGDGHRVVAVLLLQSDGFPQERHGFDHIVAGVE